MFLKWCVENVKHHWYVRMVSSSVDIKSSHTLTQHRRSPRNWSCSITWNLAFSLFARIALCLTLSANSIFRLPTSSNRTHFIMGAPKTIKQVQYFSGEREKYFNQTQKQLHDGSTNHSDDCDDCDVRGDGDGNAVVSSYLWLGFSLTPYGCIYLWTDWPAISHAVCVCIATAFGYSRCCCRRRHRQPLYMQFALSDQCILYARIFAAD